MIVDLKKHTDNVVNIVTPVYMPGERFNLTIESMLNQTDQDYRWYIGFDKKASYHRALKRCPLMSKLETMSNVTIDVNNKHTGVAKTRNRLLDKIHVGKVGFLDSDQSYYKDTVALVKAYKAAEPKFHMVMFPMAFSSRPKHIKMKDLVVSDGVPMSRQVLDSMDVLKLFYNYKVDVSMLFHDVDRELRFDESLETMCHKDYILRLFQKNPEIKTLDGFPLVFHYIEQHKYSLRSIMNHEKGKALLLRKHRGIITSELRKYKATDDYIDGLYNNLKY